MDGPAVHLTKLRELRVIAGSDAHRPSHLSAASGLVRLGSMLYVVADDELHLGAFPIDGNTPGQLIRILPDHLPDSPKERKKAKPDFEALMRLPPLRGFPAGALLALGSGSKRRRRSGVIIPIDAEKPDPDATWIIDCTELFEALATEVDDLNIEGALVTGDRLLMLHRGNKSHAANAIFTFDLDRALEEIVARRMLGNLAIRGISYYELGEIGGIPLCFTDGTALEDGRIVFSAVAEDTSDSYLDGPCVGTAIGTIAADGDVQSLERIDRVYKIEGVHAELENGVVRLWLVTDADDVHTPASLLTATFA